MASRLGVSRGTVRQSILNLVHQGFLERRKGVGTRVVQTGLVAWASLTGEMRRKESKSSRFCWKFRKNAPREKWPMHSKCRRGPRLNVWTRSVDGMTDRFFSRVRGFILGLNFPVKKIFGGRFTSFSKTETGVVADHAREEFLAVTADRPTARRLKIKKGTPLLLRRRTIVRLSKSSNRIRRNSLRHRGRFADVNLSLEPVD